jgi:hypothetical protein
MSEVTTVNTASSTGVSKFGFLTNNKDIVRIIVEVLVLIGICYYFNSRNSKTLKHMEELSQRMEEQEDENEKTRNKISELTTVIESLTRALERQSTVPQRQPLLRKQPKNTVTHIEKFPEPTINNIRPDTPTIGSHTQTVDFLEEHKEQLDVEILEEDLDDELSDELDELQTGKSGGLD